MIYSAAVKREQLNYLKYFNSDTVWMNENKGFQHPSLPPVLTAALQPAQTNWIRLCVCVCVCSCRVQSVCHLILYETQVTHCVYVWVVLTLFVSCVIECVCVCVCACVCVCVSQLSFNPSILRLPCSHPACPLSLSQTKRGIPHSSTFPGSRGPRVHGCGALPWRRGDEVTPLWYFSD